LYWYLFGFPGYINNQHHENEKATKWLGGPPYIAATLYTDTFSRSVPVLVTSGVILHSLEGHQEEC